MKEDLEIKRVLYTSDHNKIMSIVALGSFRMGLRIIMELKIAESLNWYTLMHS